MCIPYQRTIERNPSGFRDSYSSGANALGERWIDAIRNDLRGYANNTVEEFAHNRFPAAGLAPTLRLHSQAGLYSSGMWETARRRKNSDSEELRSKGLVAACDVAEATTPLEPKEGLNGAPTSDFSRGRNITAKAVSCERYDIRK